MQPLVTVADLRSVWVFLQAYEKDLALLHEGVPVTIRTEAFPQTAFEGRVDYLGSVVDKATRTTRVRATVANGAEKLRPGMFVKAQVHVPKPEAEAKATVAVPQACAPDAGGPYDGVRPDRAGCLRASLRRDGAHPRGLHRDPLRS